MISEKQNPPAPCIPAADPLSGAAVRLLCLHLAKPQCIPPNAFHHSVLAPSLPPARLRDASPVLPRSLPVQCENRGSSPESRFVPGTRCCHPAGTVPYRRFCTNVRHHPG